MALNHRTTSCGSLQLGGEGNNPSTTTGWSSKTQPSHLHVTTALTPPLPPHCPASPSGPFTQHPRPWALAKLLSWAAGQWQPTQRALDTPTPLSGAQCQGCSAPALHPPRAEHRSSRTSQHPRADVPVLHRHSQHPSGWQVVASVTCVFTLRLCTLLSLTMASVFWLARKNKLLARKWSIFQSLPVSEEECWTGPVKPAGTIAPSSPPPHSPPLPTHPQTNKQWDCLRLLMHLLHSYLHMLKDGDPLKTPTTLTGPTMKRHSYALSTFPFLKLLTSFQFLCSFIHAALHPHGSHPGTKPGPHCHMNGVRVAPCPEALKGSKKKRRKLSPLHSQTHMFRKGLLAFH